MSLAQEFRDMGATVYEPKDDKSAVRLETNLLFVDTQVVHEAMLELRFKAITRELSATDTLMLLVFKDSNIKF